MDVRIFCFINFIGLFLFQGIKAFSIGVSHLGLAVRSFMVFDFINDQFSSLSSSLANFLLSNYL